MQLGSQDASRHASQDGLSTHAGQGSQAGDQRRPIFEDLLVVEAGGRIAAAVAGSALAQLGATVIVLENAAPDPRPHLKCPHRAQLIAGKHSVVIDGERDAALLAALLQRANRVLTSSDVDTVRYEQLAGPATVVCDITAYGSGPLALAAARDGQSASGDCSDVGIQALTGMIDSTGLAGHPPTPVALPLVEHLAGIHAAGGAICALRQRGLQGLAQNLDIALYDIAFSAMNSFLAPVLASGGTKGVSRVGNRHNMAAPWNVYRAQDEWLLLCSGSDEQWQRLCKLIGREELSADPRFAKNADRVAHVNKVDAVVQARIGQRPVAECVDAILALGLPCGAVAPIDGTTREANLEYRGMLRVATDPVRGAIIHLPGSPWRMSATPGEAVRFWPPHKNGRSVFFVFQNSDKKSYLADMDSDQGRKALQALIATADVVIENLRPGALARKGLGPADMLRANPRLIYCSVSGFGADSIYPGRAAFDTVIQAMSGLMDMTRAEDTPMKTGPSFADMMGAGAGFCAIAAALAERERSGQGQFIDLSMQDIAAWTTQLAWNGMPAQSERTRLVACADGYVVADAIDDVRLGIALAGIDAATLSRSDLATALNRQGITTWPILDVREAVAAPQTHARKLWFWSDGTDEGYALLAIPVGLRRTPPQVEAVASDLGADNEAINASCQRT